MDPREQQVPRTFSQLFDPRICTLDETQAKLMERRKKNLIKYRKDSHEIKNNREEKLTEKGERSVVVRWYKSGGILGNRRTLEGEGGKPQNYICKDEFGALLSFSET